MSTTQQQTSQFAPSGMATYDALQPSLGQALGWYLGGGKGGGVGSNAGPFGSPIFKAGYAQNTINAEQQGQTAMGNLGMSASQFGGGGVPGFLQSQARQIGYGVSGQQQQGYWGALNSAVGSQLGAANTAAGFRPLQTGSTQKTSGLGSWLPQVLGGALGLGGSLLNRNSGGSGFTPTLGGSPLGFNTLMAGVTSGALPTAPTFGLPSGLNVPGLGASMTGAVPRFPQSGSGGNW